VTCLAIVWLAARWRDAASRNQAPGSFIEPAQLGSRLTGPGWLLVPQHRQGCLPRAACRFCIADGLRRIAETFQDPYLREQVTQLADHGHCLPTGSQGLAVLAVAMMDPAQRVKAYGLRAAVAELVERTDGRAHLPGSGRPNPARTRC
jgi:hypothetical protein